MLGVAAAVSGCPQRVLITPPGPDGKVPSPTLVAAAEVGITEIYVVGGAQAIAALAYGSESIEPVDKIFGPGNAYVTAAKLAVFSQVAIDVPAGRSELMIVADGSAEPAWIAADMIANAEHAPDSPVVLICLSEGLVKRVNQAVLTQLETLPRHGIARRALADCGAVIVVADVEKAMIIVNEYAPEHLQIMVDDPNRMLRMVENAGSVSWARIRQRCRRLRYGYQSRAANRRVRTGVSGTLDRVLWSLYAGARAGRGRRGGARSYGSDSGPGRGVRRPCTRNGDSRQVRTTTGCSLFAVRCCRRPLETTKRQTSRIVPADGGMEPPSALLSENFFLRRFAILAFCG